MSDILYKAAEILVECGYAEVTAENGIMLVKYGVLGVCPESVDPFYSGDDTHRECKSRRQADAIEDWLHQNHYKLILKAKHAIMGANPYHGREKRLDRIKWCLSENDQDSMQKAGE